MLGKPSASLRLRELLQRVEPDGKVGKLTNIVSRKNNYLSSFFEGLRER